MDELRSLINKYYVLLTASSMAKWEPVPQYNTLAQLAEAWLFDDPEVLRAVRRALDAAD